MIILLVNYILFSHNKSRSKSHRFSIFHSFINIIFLLIFNLSFNLLFVQNKTYAKLMYYANK